MRVPYNKDSYGGAVPPARFFARHGYAVVVQDARGKFKSEGEYRVYNGDVTDSWDAIEWASTQLWSTGRVGTYGCSYLGENQIIATAQRHPAHMAALPQAAGGIVGTSFGTLEGGVFALSAGYGWFPRVAGPSRGFTAPAPVDVATQLETLPVRSMLERIDQPSWDWDQFFLRPLDDPYWTEIGYASDDNRFDVPALHVNSWYDLGVGETLLLFDLMRRNGESPRAQGGQYVIISPPGHCQSEGAGEHTMVGDRDYGDARLDYYRIYLDWFDHWLKDADNGVTDMPHVQAYVLGRNEWAALDQWPPLGTRFQRLHLHSDSSANDPDGGGHSVGRRRAGRRLRIGTRTIPVIRHRHGVDRCAAREIRRTSRAALTRATSRSAKMCSCIRRRCWPSLSPSSVPSTPCSRCRLQPATRTSR